MLFLIACLFAVSFVSIESNGIIPFNPKFNNKGQCLLFNDKNRKDDSVVADRSRDTIRGTLRMMNKEFKYYDVSSNASRTSNDYVFYYYPEWNGKAKSPEPWLTWKKNDIKKKRLFRPFMFYDVLGMMELYFQKRVLQNFQEKNYRDNISKIILKPRAIDDGASPFSLLTVKKLRNQKIKTVDVAGEIMILDGYVIWEKGKANKTKLASEQARYFDSWKNNITEFGLIGALQYTDIRYLQAAYPGAVFQIASNFNCLEGHIETFPLEYMQFTPTQGELAVSCAMGGGFIRKYLIPFKDRDLLVNVSGVTTDETSAMAKFTGKLDSTNISQIAVGVHQNVQVTSGYYPPYVRTDKYTLKQQGAQLKNNRGEPTYLENIDSNDAQAIVKNNSAENFDLNQIQFLYKNQIVNWERLLVFVYNGEVKNDIFVNQIFTSAVRLDRKSTDTTAIKNAKIILQGMQEGTVLAAARLFDEQRTPVNKRYLFLTLLGTGAFWNEVEWVMDALNQKTIIDTIRDSGMKVVIVIYPDPRPGRGLDGRQYNERDNSNQMAIPGIYEMVETINKEIQKKSELKSNAPQAVEILAKAFDSLK